MSKKKRAKFNFQPRQQKVPHIAEDAERFRKLNFQWRVLERYIDFDHEDWGWGKVTIQEFFLKLLPRLYNYETMTWNDILRRPSCHSIEVSEVCGKAQQRLEEIHPDIDTLHQIDTSRLGRLWGYREHQTMYLIWHDPKHTVYPV
ncbi:hypothetical protein ES703_12759 [subsurface metagenome]